MELLIVGGGLAAQRCIEVLRAAGDDRPVTVVCDEPVRPYDRPPLSKEGLLGEIEPAFRPAGWYADHGVELRLGVAARSLDPGAPRRHARRRRAAALRRAADRHGRPRASAARRAPRAGAAQRVRRRTAPLRPAGRRSAGRRRRGPDRARGRRRGAGARRRGDRDRGRAAAAGRHPRPAGRRVGDGAAPRRGRARPHRRDRGARPRRLRSSSPTAPAWSARTCSPGSASDRPPNGWPAAAWTRRAWPSTPAGAPVCPASTPPAT